MIELEQCAIVVLASGLSRRFGDSNKLLAPVNDRPLAEYSARTAQQTPAKHRFAVIPSSEPSLKQCYEAHGLAVVDNDEPSRGMGRSLSLGIDACIGKNCAGVLVLLADMPNIKPAHLELLRDAIGPNSAAFASIDGRPSPPALFAQRLLPRLQNLDGDQGARAILTELPDAVAVSLPPECLLDIDSRSDIRALAGENDKA